MFKTRNILLITDRIFTRNDYKKASKYRNVSLINSDGYDNLFSLLHIKEISLKNLTKILKHPKEEEKLSDYFDLTSLIALDVSYKYNECDNYTSPFKDFSTKGVDCVLVSDDEMPCEFIKLYSKENELSARFACLYSLNNNDTPEAPRVIQDGTEKSPEKLCNLACGELIIHSGERSNPLLLLIGELKKNFDRIKKTNIIPIFKMSFLVDKALWNYFYGDYFFKQRLHHNLKEGSYYDKPIDPEDFVAKRLK